MNNRRVVITGLGVVSSIGTGWQAFWNALLEGASGISEVKSFDTSKLPTHYGGEVRNFQSLEKTGRASSLAVAAAKLAIEDSKMDIENTGRERFGVCMGTTMGESQVLEELNDCWIKHGQEAMDPQLIPQYPCSVLASNVCRHLRIDGARFVIPTACAAGNYAIGYACDLIRSGVSEVMLAGGADAFSRIAFIGFNRLFAVAPRMCQPFDKNRKGIMVGEGAGMVLLEPLENALRRNAPIYAEVAGYGLSCDAHHMTAPQSEGIKRSILNALKESHIASEQVDYFNAHGTGTVNNDREECKAIKEVFKDNCKDLPVSSIKSMLGHTMGAASALEAITCALSAKFDLIPPTINFETPDPECDIDCVANESRQRRVNVALNNSSAFGGNNACLILKKYP